MAGLEEALPGLIMAGDGVSDLVGDRVFWVQMPEEIDVVPYALLTWAGGVRDRHVGGFSGIAESRVQIDAIASGVHTNAVLVARAISDHLDGFTGVSGGVDFQYVSGLGRFDQKPFKIGDAWRFRVMCEFRLAWSLAPQGA